MNKQSPVYVLGFTVVLSLVFGLGVAAVHYATQGLLEKNQALHRNRIIAKAFMLDVDAETPSAYLDAVTNKIRIDTLAGDGSRRFIVFKNTETGDIGFQFGGMGFWDRIEGIAVLEPSLQEFVNVQFLEQKETPGLGARIEEQVFTEQFKGLEIAWNAAREIVIDQSESDADNHVDAITGATQTSIALMNLMNEELEAFRNTWDTYDQQAFE